MTDFGPGNNQPLTKEQLENAIQNGTTKGAFLASAAATVTNPDGDIVHEQELKFAGPVIQTELGDIALPTLSEQQIDLLKIETPQQVYTALKGDSGEIRSTAVSAGYSKKYADNFGNIFKNSNN